MMTMMKFLHVVVDFLLLGLSYSVADELSLREDFYDSFCPLAESIVNSIVTQHVFQDHSTAPALVRMAFHDCFVQGCDASILLLSSTDFEAERDAFPNKDFLRGYSILDEIKQSLEKTCPTTVSCADIVIMAARDAIVSAGGPYYSVAKGRRDSLSSIAEVAEKNLPSPMDDISSMIELFKSKGLNETDLVVLLGSHTLGQAHCIFVEPRLYNFSSSGLPDPHLNIELFFHLSSACPRQQHESSRNHTVPLDAESSTAFDNNYFKNVLRGKGVLFVDQVLMDDPLTSNLVSMYASNQVQFFKDFTSSMRKMSNIGVLTAAGGEGEIRKHCAFTLADSRQPRHATSLIQKEAPPPASTSASITIPYAHP